MSNIKYPNTTALIMSALLINPSTENDNLISIVEMTKPELRMMV